RRLGARFEEPLHAEADAEQRSAERDAFDHGVDPGLVERARGVEVADAGHDDRAGAGELWRFERCEHLRANCAQRLPPRRQVAGLVVDECDRHQSSPLVDGSMRASRLSRAQATRSARANALKTASILWWLDRPYITLTCTFARAPIAKPSKKSCT